MFLHPEMDDNQFVNVSTSIVEQEVGTAFGLTNKEIAAVESVNDKFNADEDEDEEPSPENHFEYEFVDGVNGETHEVYTFDRQGFEDAVYDYENREILPDEAVIADRRLALIKHLDAVCQEYDEGYRTADWYGP